MITFSHIGRYGRLGNQMFQYATLLNIALINNYNYGIPYSNKVPIYFVNDPRGKFQYGLELHKCFKITAPNVTDFSFIRAKHQALQFNYYPEILKIPDNTDIIGYFQSEKFFKENRNFILKEFTFKDEIKIEAQKQINNYKSKSKKLVSVHVRRGDYITIQQHHPMLTKENYYNKAIDIFSDMDCTYIFFSDDIEYCKKYFGEKNNYIFSTGNDTFIDMCVMSMCDHHIIANSSFSWWGSYLNKNKGKKVIAPKIWFGPAHANLNTEDLIPKKWLKI